MKTRLPNLQILRFVAAAMVLLSHVQHEALKMTFLDGWHYLPWEAVYLGGGVDIFFVISGFIMYTISTREFGVPGTLKRFFLRRLLRIVPMYWLFSTAMVAAAIVYSRHVTHSALSFDHVLASYFFIPYKNAYGGTYPILILGWTLNYEVFFYAVFGCALFLRRAAGISLVFLAIGGLAVLGLMQAFTILPFSFWSNPIVLEFLFGIGLAMLRERGLRCSLKGALALVGGGCLAMALLKSAGIAEHFWFVRFLWMGLPALSIAAGAVLVRHSATADPVTRLFVFLGDSSYSLYLSHPFALNLVAVLWLRTGLQRPELYILISCVFAVAAACAVHLLFEKPVTSYLERQVSRLLGARASMAPQAT